MSQRPPVKDWATDFDHLDQRWINDPFPIWDDMRKTVPDRPYGSLHGRLLPLALRGRAGRRLRHRAFLLAPHHRARDAAAAHSRAADHLRPARAPPGAHGAAAALHAGRHEEAGAAGARAGQRADRQVRQARHRRCGGRVRAGDPGSPHRPHAGSAGGRRRSLSQVDQDGAGGRHHRRQHRRRGRGRDDALLHGLRARAHGEAGRRPDQLPHQGAGTTASRCRPKT